MTPSAWHVVLGAIDELVERRRASGRPAVEELMHLRAVVFRFMPGQAGSTSPFELEAAEGGRMTSLVLDIEDTAQALRVSPSTVKRLIKAGDLPAVKVAGATRVRTTDLAGYVARLEATNLEVR